MTPKNPQFWENLEAKFQLRVTHGAAERDWLELFYLRQGYVFARVCLSVCMSVC